MKKSLIMAVLAISTLLNADYVVEYQMDNSTQVFKYHSDKSSKIVMQNDGFKSEIYKVKDKTYMVTHMGSEKNIIDLAKMKEMAKAMGLDNAKEEEAPEFKVKKTGKKVMVAGIKGEEWVLYGSENGEKYSETIVVSDNKKVVKAMRAMSKLFASTSDMLDENIFEPRRGFVMIKSDFMQLKSFKEQSVPSSEYKLPR